MQKLFKVESCGLGLSNTPILQYSLAQTWPRASLSLGMVSQTVSRENHRTEEVAPGRAKTAGHVYRQSH